MLFRGVNKGGRCIQLDEKTENAIINLIEVIEKQNKRYYNIIISLIAALCICTLGILSILYFSDYKGPSVEQSNSEFTQKIN